MMKDFVWYCNRLALMSLPEVTFRILSKVNTVRERYFSLKDSRRRHGISSQTAFFLHHIDNIREYLTPWKATILTNAEQNRQHRFCFFALQNAELGPEIDWHTDYRSGAHSPQYIFGKSINHRKTEDGWDIKYIWEINRWQHLVRMAKAAWILEGKSDGLKFRDEIVLEIDSWASSNLFMRGVNWASALEAAIRLIVLFFVWELLHSLDLLKSEVKQRWLKLIELHCLFISRNFSRYSSANNHLIGEAAGLFVGSLYWPCLPKADVWREKSFQILVKEIDRQTYPDGGNKEQAFAYLGFVLDFFLLAVLVGEANGQKFPTSYWANIERMMDFLASIMDADGNVPKIGDEDDGNVIVLDDSLGFSNYRSILATGAVLFDRPDWASKAEALDQKTLWLLGERAIEWWKRYEALSPDVHKPQVCFSKSGYYILGENFNARNEFRVLVDAGPLGYLSICAHGHADALSFVLSVAGQEMIVDPGTYSYHTKEAWRIYFRGTSAHNTVCIDSQDQSTMGGPFMWLKKAKTQVEKLVQDSDGNVKRLVASHDGYSRLTDSVLHRRTFYYSQGSYKLEILDEILADQEHEIEVFFHFHPAVETQYCSEGILLFRDSVRLRLQLDPVLQVSLHHGEEDPVLGWYSAGYDNKQPTWTVRGRFKGKGMMRHYVERI